MKEKVSSKRLKTSLFYIPVIALPLLFVLVVLLLGFLLRLELQKGVSAGGCTIVAKELYWQNILQFRLEKIVADCNGAQVEAPHVEISWNPFKIFRGQVKKEPAVQISTGLVQVILTQDSGKKSDNGKNTIKKERLESLPSSLPIPLSTEIQLQGVLIREKQDTLGSGVDLIWAVQNPRTFQFAAREASFGGHSTQNFRLSGEASQKNWKLEVESYLGESSVLWNSVHPLNQPLSFSGAIKGDLSSYRSTFMDMGYKIWPFQKLEGNFDVNLDNSWFLMANIKVQLDSFSVPYLRPMVLSPHNMELDIHLRSDSLRLSFFSQGEKGEKAELEFVGKPMGEVSLQNLFTEIQSEKIPSGLVSITTENFYWPLGNSIMPLNVSLKNGEMEQGVLKGVVQTQHGSSIRAQLDLTRNLETTFEGLVSVEEPWAVGWTNGNFYYDSLSVNGKWSLGTNAHFGANVFGAYAYGSEVDTLKTEVELSTRDIVFSSSSTVQVGSTVWPLAGKVYWGGHENASKDQGLYFQMEHRKFGKVRYEMPSFQEMFVFAEELYVTKVPYPLLKKGDEFSPILTGDFYWNFENNVGNVIAESKGLIEGLPMQAFVESNWTPQRMNISEWSAVAGREKAYVSGNVNLRGRPFYEVYKLSWADVDSLSVEADEFNVAAWLNRYIQFPLQSLVMNGGVAYSPNRGFLGNISGTNWKKNDTDSLFSVMDIQLKGTGDVVELSAGMSSANVPFLNGVFRGEVSHLNLEESPVRMEWLGPTFEGVWSGSWLKPNLLSGEVNILGEVTFPDSLGGIKDFFLNGDMWMDVSKPSQAYFNGKEFWGKYVHPMVGEMSWDGNVYYGKGGDPLLSLPNLKVQNQQGQIFEGTGQYYFNPNPLFVFQGFSDTWSLRLGQEAKDYKGQVNMKELELALVWNSSGVQVEGNVDGGSASIPLGEEEDYVTSVIEQLELSYFYPTHQRTYEPQILEGLVTLSDFELSYEGVTIRKIGELFTGLFQNTSYKVPEQKKSSRPLELDVQITSQGRNNHVYMDFVKASFEGDVQISGTYPILLLNGEVNSLDGTLGLTENAYRIEEFNVQWNHENTEQGRILARAEKTMARSCSPGEVENCFLGVVLTGTLENMELQYEGDCGDELGETVDPRVIFSSISQDCYDGSDIDVSVLMDQGVSRILSSWVTQVGQSKSKWVSWLGHIDQCEVSGVQNAFQDTIAINNTVVSSDVDNSNAIYIGCKTKEFGNSGVRLGSRWGFVPNATEDWSEREVSVEWKPKFVDNVQVDVKGKTRPSSNQDRDEDQEQELRLKAGVSYIYRFWEMW